MSKRTLRLQTPELDESSLGYFRFGELDGWRVLTNDAGEWLTIRPDDFDKLLAGQIDDSHPQFDALRRRGFLRADLDLEDLTDKVRRKKRWLGQGPHLAVVITSLRCNQSCKYCHASRVDMDKVETDMSIETAKKVVDHAMQTPSPYLNFEFQGGEPTVNMDVIRFIVEYSREKNKIEKKLLDYSLVTNMTMMTEEVGRWLMDNGVLLCTSLDGPEHVHNFNRPWKKGAAAYAHVIKWIKWFNQQNVDQGRDPELWHVDALMTTTKRSIENWREIIDLYVDLGIRNIHLRPLNPFGFANKTWRAIGYTQAEYLAFYEQSLDYILQLNRQGVHICEGTASVFLKKMLTPNDPNFVDIRSPVGSGTGQIAYNYDGSIYPSDEGRMISAMGNELFRLGNVDDTPMNVALGHPTVRALAVSSLLDTLPQCSTCWNVPYCGVRPLHNYMHSGDIFGQRPNTFKCVEHMGISKILLQRLADDPDGQNEGIFRRWVVDRPRDSGTQ
jgi:His-Xaa-Ser system radical SAM maturase HxsB